MKKQSTHLFVGKSLTDLKKIADHELDTFLENISSLFDKMPEGRQILQARQLLREIAGLKIKFIGETPGVILEQLSSRLLETLHKSKGKAFCEKLDLPNIHKNAIDKPEVFEAQFPELFQQIASYDSSYVSRANLVMFHSER